MPAVQQLLFPDPRPLVDRLGRDFFLSLPASPGVYVIRDAHEAPIYIGKAKNLRQRLRAYRVANPGRMKRRHLRLLGAAVAIDVELCNDEDAALAREAELILLHRPRFNRAGTWPVSPRYVGWRMIESSVELIVTEQLEEGWMGAGPFGSGGARRYRAASVRLIWFLAHPGDSVEKMPFGWIYGRLGENAQVDVGGERERILAIIQALADSSTEALSIAVRSMIEGERRSFVVELVDEDLKRLGRFAGDP